MYLNIHFEYDGIRSIEMKVGAYHEDGIVAFHYGLNRQLQEEKIKDKTILYKIQNQDIVFEMLIAKINGEKWTYEERMKTCEWLFKGDYKPLILCDYPYLKYYILFEECPERTDFGSETGYIKVKVKCRNPYAYSNIGMERYILNKNINTLKLKNRSNLNEKIYPIFEMIALEDIDKLTITNMYNNIPPSIINNVKQGEIITLNNLTREIYSNQKQFVLGDFNKQWIYLNKGINKFRIEGKIDIIVLYQFPVVI